MNRRDAFKSAGLALVASVAEHTGGLAPAEAVMPSGLRGVAIGDSLLSRANRPDSDFDDIAELWGANVVRISIHPGIWRAQRAESSAAMNRTIEAASRRGLSVIIDWHAIGWPGGSFERPDPSWGLPADLYDCDLPLALGFWSAMAARYGQRDDVLFELWNEPVDLELKGDARPPGADWARLRPVWNSMIKTLRLRASNQLIVSGGSWAADLTGVRNAPLADPGVGYGWHVYPGTGGRDPERWSSLLDGADTVAPIYVTEWGFGGTAEHLRGTAGGYGAAFAEGFLNARRLNWTAWCWQPDWEPALLEKDWRTPTAAGRFVQGLLKRV